MTLRPKYVASLTFRGFDMQPIQVEALVGIPASELGVRGQPRRPGLRPLVKSFASWQVEFPDSAQLNEMIPSLIERAGGVDRLVSVKNEVKPEFFEVDLSLCIKDSQEQEGGFFDSETLSLLSRLGVCLSLGFYERGDAQ
jgi:hypothetical protein